MLLSLPAILANQIRKSFITIKRSCQRRSAMAEVLSWYPVLKTQPHNTCTVFVRVKRNKVWKQAIGMGDQVANMAKQIGLEYNFHKLFPKILLMVTSPLGLCQNNTPAGQSEETLFKSYFTHGKNIDTSATLMQLGRK